MTDASAATAPSPMGVKAELLKWLTSETARGKCLWDLNANPPGYLYATLTLPGGPDVPVSLSPASEDVWKSRRLTVNGCEFLCQGLDLVHLLDAMGEPLLLAFDADFAEVEIPVKPLVLDEEAFLKDVPPAPVSPKGWWIIITGDGQRWHLELAADEKMPPEDDDNLLRATVGMLTGNLPTAPYKVALSDQRPLGTEAWPVFPRAASPATDRLVPRRDESANKRQWLLIVGPTGKRWSQPIPHGTVMPEKVTRDTLAAILVHLDCAPLPADHKIALCQDCPLAANPWFLRGMAGQPVVDGPLL